jgi:hypothetical protein
MLASRGICRLDSKPTTKVSLTRLTQFAEIANDLRR